MSNDRPLFKKITQVALVVKSVDETVRKCWEQFGMGPWTYRTFDPSKVADMTIRGRRIDYAMRTAHARIGEIDWEIIEPLDDRSIFAEHLRTRGEGLHHVMFEVEDYGKAKARVLENGNPEVQYGSFVGHPFSFFDTQSSLGCILELWSPPADRSVLPPFEKSYP